MPRQGGDNSPADRPTVESTRSPRGEHGTGRQKLPEELQKLVNRADAHDDGLLDKVVEGQAPDSTESSLRYAAYATRLRTLLSSAHRYVAYTSDVGESFRPIAHPVAMRAAYAVSWLYLVGDVGYEGYRARLRNVRTRADPGAATVAPLEDYRTVMAQRAVFQSVASMGLPALTIHSVVHYAGRAMRRLPNVALRTWTPIGLGLGVVPFLPYLFDHPVERAVERVFRGGFSVYGRLAAPATRSKTKEL